jgi:four helix bundle protein
MGHFDPEKIAAYRLSRLHSRAVRSLLGRAKSRGFADLVSQLRRSAASIPANVLEALGEWRPGKRLHYMMIAKGSAYECWAHTDSLIDFGLVNVAAVEEVRGIQKQIIAVLTATIRNAEAEVTRNAATRNKHANTDS